MSMHDSFDHPSPIPRAGQDDAETRPYRVRPEEVWQAARTEYIAGFSAEAVCAQFDLGLSAFRQRARREGWRKSDLEADHAEPIGFPPEPDAAPATGDLVDLAWRSAAQAIRRGRVYEARAWLRLVDELKAEARAQSMTARMADAMAARAAAEAEEEEEEAVEAPEPDELHTLHPDVEVQFVDDDTVIMQETLSAQTEPVSRCALPLAARESKGGGAGATMADVPPAPPSPCPLPRKGEEGAEHPHPP